MIPKNAINGVSRYSRKKFGNPATRLPPPVNNGGVNNTNHKRPLGISGTGFGVSVSGFKSESSGGEEETGAEPHGEADHDLTDEIEEAKQDRRAALKARTQR